jgi:hypothetical protein
MVLLQDLNTDSVTTGLEIFNRLGWKFFMRLGIDLLSMFILVRFIYYPHARNREFLFTYFVFNLIIFLITFLLNKVEMSMGAAFGLFAVFSIIRYRTEDITIRDMTYLFLSIALGLIMAVTRGSWDEFTLMSIIILVFTWLLESNILMRRESTKIIFYEKIDLIRPENQQIMLDDLKARTGFNVHRYSISRIDFLKDMAIIKIYFYESENGK